MADTLGIFNSSIAWFTEQKKLNCSPKIRAWLSDPDSLTLKLESLAKTFEVRVKSQELIKPSTFLSGYFNYEIKVLVRNVFLYVDHKAVIFAQTEIPISTLNAHPTILAYIDNQPLGKILFNHANMTRDAFDFFEFKEHSSAHQLLKQINQSNNDSLWARRSLFYLNNNPLLVSELFLPASGIYK